MINFWQTLPTGSLHQHVPCWEGWDLQQGAPQQAAKYGAVPSSPHTPQITTMSGSTQWIFHLWEWSSSCHSQPHKYEHALRANEHTTYWDWCGGRDRRPMRVLRKYQGSGKALLTMHQLWFDVCVQFIFCVYENFLRLSPIPVWLHHVQAEHGGGGIWKENQKWMFSLRRSQLYQY